jgi:hypothetical protein
MADRVIAQKIVFFRFEEDFVDSGIRCIPMIVRFKLDACGIKLKLSEWNRLSSGQRMEIAYDPCGSAPEALMYREKLCRMVTRITGEMPSSIPVPDNPAWSRKDEVPYTIQEKLREVSSAIEIAQWQQLTDLQRFALRKLSYPGHENRNFPKALAEFGLGTW